MKEFDYVIVGAGTAGCLLAYRLGAEGHSVAVLEAGGPDRDPLIHIPLGLGRMHEKRLHDWGYDTDPEPYCQDREIEAMRGKVVGGSSSINYMGYVRGNRGDYDRWARDGARGWTYAELLPYFRRTETWEFGANTYRGGDGPLRIILTRTQDPIFDAFKEAGHAIGLPHHEDFNAAEQEGTARAQQNVHRGRRQSAAAAFLRPAIARGNVELIHSAQATRVMMEGTRAVGVEFQRAGARDELRAAREVILSGGVFNSPQLLMLSGIGPADHLKEIGITPVIDQPAVGGNLQDHMGVAVGATRPSPGPFVNEMRFDRLATSMVRAYLFGEGPATVLPSLMHGFVRTDASQEVPDIQLIYRGVAVHPTMWFPGIRKPYTDGCGIRPILLHPKSRGRVLLRSSNPLDKVRIRQNFFAEPDDVAKMRLGVKMAREMLASKPLDGFRGDEVMPGPKRQTDAEIDQFIRATCLTAHHPSGTCPMGEGDDRVLDSELRVKGAQNLRVVDASAMPDLISGNINAAVMVIAEKGSDMILGKQPLPRANV